MKVHAEIDFALFTASEWAAFSKHIYNSEVDPGYCNKLACPIFALYEKICVPDETRKDDEEFETETLRTEDTWSSVTEESNMTCVSDDNFICDDEDTQ